MHESAQSKYTWTCHKSHFKRKFTAKMLHRQDRDTRFVRACALEMHTDMSQEPFYVGNYTENAGRYRYHAAQTARLNTYRKNLSVWPHCLGEKKIGKIKQKLGNKKMLRKRKYPGKSERKTCKIMPESWCNIFFLLLNTPGLFAAYGAKDIALLRTDGLKLSIQHPLHALGTKKMSVDACDTWGCLVPAQIVRERFRPMSKFPSWGMKAKPQKTHRLPPFPQQKLCRNLAQKARCCLCKPQESHD